MIPDSNLHEHTGRCRSRLLKQAHRHAPRTTVCRPNSLHARMTRTAISPRLAMSTCILTIADVSIQQTCDVGWIPAANGSVEYNAFAMQSAPPTVACCRHDYGQHVAWSAGLQRYAM